MKGGKRFWLAVLLSAILLAFFFATLDFRRLVEALVGANYLYLAPGLALYLVGVWFRALRWRRLLRHLRPISVSRLFPIVVVGYMANNILPFRLGEIVRSYYLGEREGVSKSAALVTILIERLLDALTLLLFVAAAAIFLPLTGLAEAFGARWNLPWPVLAASVSLPFVAAFGSLVVLASKPDWARRLARAGMRPLPIGLRERATDIAEKGLEGLQSLKSPSELLSLFLLSVPIWLFEAGLFFMVAYSFGLAEAYGNPLEMYGVMIIVTAVANIAASIPLGPGGVGLFELAARETLTLLPLAAVDRAVAGGFAAVAHATLIIPIIALGQAFLWWRHVSLRSLIKR